MVRKWKKVDNKCIVCKKEVAKVKLNDGKIEIVENINFGSFVKVKGKAEMKMICRNCQKILDKEGKKYSDFL